MDILLMYTVQFVLRLYILVLIIFSFLAPGIFAKWDLVPDIIVVVWKNKTKHNKTDTNKNPSPFVSYLVPISYSWNKKLD